MFNIEEGMLFNNEQKIQYNMMRLLEKNSELLERVLKGEKINEGVKHTKEDKKTVDKQINTDMDKIKDISEMNRQELIKLAKEKGMSGNLNTKKTDELIDFLKGAE